MKERTDASTRGGRGERSILRPRRVTPRGDHHPTGGERVARSDRRATRAAEKHDWRVVAAPRDPTGDETTESAEAAGDHRRSTAR